MPLRRSPSPQVTQAMLPLDPPPVRWETLPAAVRTRVVALWTQRLLDAVSGATCDPIEPRGPQTRHEESRA